MNCFAIYAYSHLMCVNFASIGENIGQVPVELRGAEVALVFSQDIVDHALC